MKTSAGFFAVALLAATGQIALGLTTHGTHRVRSLRNGRRAVAFQAASEYETFGEGIDHIGNGLTTRGDYKSVGLSFIKSRLPDSDTFVTSGFTSDVSDHVYVQQTVNGIPVSNAVANVALSKSGKVTAFGHSFVTDTTSSRRVSNSTPALSATDAIARAEDQLAGTHDGTPSKLEYVHTEDGNLILTRTVQLWEAEGAGHLLEAFVDAHSGEVVAVNDFTASITYRVLPIGKQAPTDGFEVLTNPEDTTASPSGWVTVPGSSAGNTTAGNNVIAYKTSTTGTTTENASGTFSYTWNSAAQPTTSPNVDVARVNAFYVANTLHDVAYRYGFTEAAFNFQQNNNGLGGAGNDRVTLSVQDSAGTDNADFSTPADGSSGHMRMYQWDLTSPRRDGAIENDIVSHEYTHGITNRMTGGGTGRCLQTTEAGGMGEGWSDAMAEWLEQSSYPLRDFTMGSYVINSAAGIRTYPYSTNATTNPLTYASIATLNEVHDIGEVWANVLHNVHSALLAVYGFSTDAKTNPSATGGNAVFLHLFIDALPLQPCNPTLPTGRDAWIQADANRFGGANKCTLWKAFASRGLGVNAASHRNDATVPSGC